MNEEEKKAIEDIKRTIELYELKPIDRISVEFDKFDYKIFKTILNLIERQQTRIQELEKINTEHQKLNGELRQEIKQLKHKIQKIMDYVDNL